MPGAAVVWSINRRGVKGIGFIDRAYQAKRTKRKKCTNHINDLVQK